MTTLPHQGLGSRTAAPSFQNCRTVETMNFSGEALHYNERKGHAVGSFFRKY